MNKPGMTGGSESDERLMLRVKAGEVEAMTELMRRYKGPLFNFLYRFVGQYEKAEDLFQAFRLLVIIVDHVHTP